MKLFPVDKLSEENLILIFADSSLLVIELPYECKLLHI